VNLIPHTDADVFVEWGTDSQSLANATPTTPLAGGTGGEVLLSPLTPDTRYYYRVQARPAAGGSWSTGPLRTFTSLPGPGAEARVCVTSDIHVTNTETLGLDEHLDLLETTFAAMEDYRGAGGYHAWIDLGDLVVIRAQRVCFDAEEVDQRYRRAREYLDLIGHSLPFVLVRGNHEEVNGWDDDATGENTAVWSGLALKKYAPPPLPDGFYSGNETPHPEIGLPGDYFAFRVGDLRVRCLDPYLFSMTRPHNGHGETGGSRDNWDWSLGDAQYEWLHADLTTHPTPYSLLMLHHLTSAYSRPGGFYGRGGIEVAKHAVAGRPTFEWGGEDSLGADVLSTKRPNWTHGSVHDLLTSRRNQVVLKGHDHFFARQELDEVTYVTLPKPNDTGQHTGNLWGWRWVTSYPDGVTTFRTNSGFLDVSAGSGGITYSYVQTYPPEGAGTIRDSFTILPAPGSTDAPSIGGGRLARNSIRSVYPNPTASSARIEYELGRRGRVRLSLHDATGRRIRDLVTEDRPAGTHQVRWDGRDRNGRRVSSGVYFVRMVTEDGRLNAVKMVMVR
jgi:hypothetical protein